jgi:hypothetical protein
MASLDYYFTEETSDLLTTKTPAYILDEALAHLASAIAALQRASPLYSAHVEPFWHFAAGTESELDYNHQVARASSLLPEKICARQDVRAGIENLKEAVLLLREFGDERDADELEDTVCIFLRNVGEEW